MRRSILMYTVSLFAIPGCCSPARAQLIETYLPSYVPGFDGERGVTVLSRLRPLYQDQGVRLGSFVVRGGLDEKFGYDSNITGTLHGPSSTLLQTNPSISAESAWSRNRLGLSASIDRYDYLSAPRQSHTDATVGIGGGLTIGKNLLDVGYSHIRGNEFGSDIGAVAYDAPVTFDVDIIRGNYTWDQGRFQFTPNIDFRLYQFGDAQFGGQTINQRYRDRTVLTGGLTTRYSVSEQRGLILVLQGSGSNYLHPVPGAPSTDSQSVLILPGIDYQATGPWRYRLLVGVEARTFQATQYSTRVAPVFEGSVIYTPTGLTTLTATLRRAIEDPQAEGTSGYTYTGLGLVVDHELRRNILLQANASFRAVDYFENLGSTTAYAFGAGMTWLLDSHLSAFATYAFTRQNGEGQRSSYANVQSPVTVLPNFTKNLALVGLRWRL